MKTRELYQFAIKNPPPEAPMGRGTAGPRVSRDWKPAPNAVQIRGFTQRRNVAKGFKLFCSASFAAWREILPSLIFA
jgi:hypothetical protein